MSWSLFPTQLKTNLCLLPVFFFFNLPVMACVDALVRHISLSYHNHNGMNSVDLVPKAPGFLSGKCVRDRSEIVPTSCSQPQVPPGNRVCE